MLESINETVCGLCVAPPSHGRGQDGSLFLLLYDSFIHSFTPVYPDAIQVNNHWLTTCPTSRLLLRHAMQRAQAPDQFRTVDPYHLAVRKQAPQRGQGHAVVRIV